MGKKIELSTAIEHYGDGLRRGEVAGRHLEHSRLLQILKKHGHYDAILTINKHAPKSSVTQKQTVVSYS